MTGGSVIFAPFPTQGCGAFFCAVNDNMDTLERFADLYPSILLSRWACSYYSYESSPHYLIPRIKSGTAEWYFCEDYVAVGNPGSARVVLPITPKKPLDLMVVIEDVVRRFGGAYDVSGVYAEHFRSPAYGFKVRHRPWGNLDFLVDTDTLIELPGKSLREIRRSRNAMDRTYLYRSLTKEDFPAMQELEKNWAFKRRGRVGNQGYSVDFLEFGSQYASHFGIKSIGAFNNTGQLTAMALGNVVDFKTWCCGFAYGDPDVPSCGDVVWHKLAMGYADYPMELDGPGGAPSSGMFLHKRKFSDRVTAQFVINRK